MFLPQRGSCQTTTEGDKTLHTAPVQMHIRKFMNFCLWKINKVNVLWPICFSSWTCGIRPLVNVKPRPKAVNSAQVLIRETSNMHLWDCGAKETHWPSLGRQGTLRVGKVWDKRPLAKSSRCQSQQLKISWQHSEICVPILRASSFRNCTFSPRQN